MKRRMYDDKFKAPIIKRLLAGENVPKLAAETKVAEGRLYAWKRAAQSEEPIKTNGTAAKAEGRMDLWTKNREAQLMQIIGQQAVEIAQLRAKLR